MNRKAETYFTEGCGRCSLGNTPACKVNKWPQELQKLRSIILDCGLTEESKWGMPCYTSENRNILLLAAFKEYCAIGFMKGGLLKDPKGILVKPGENTQTVRQIRFTNLREVTELESTIKAYIKEALDVENSGAKVTLKENPEPIPQELQNKLVQLPKFKTAFEALTRGRQRGYILYFSAPKQSKTREARIEKCMSQILAGRGLYD